MPRTDRPTYPIEDCTHGTTHYHGTRAGYTTHGCRGDDCREAQNNYQRAQRKDRPAPVGDLPPELDHFDFRTELPDWHLEAACRGMDIRLFFPGKSQRGVSDRAKRVCARCPVQAECLEWAVEMNEPGGVWGGTTERQRRQLRSLAGAGALGEVVSAFVKKEAS